MAPTLRTRPKPKPKPIPKPRTEKKPRRTNFKNQKVVLKKPNTINQEVSSSCSKISCSSQVDQDGLDFEVLDTSASSTPCSTPKAERFRIPEIVACPPAPKKKRVLSSSSSSSSLSSNCSNLQRTPISFFAPPDLELFFFVALRDIPV